MKMKNENKVVVLKDPRAAKPDDLVLLLSDARTVSAAEPEDLNEMIREFVALY